jgi:AcrR family transcriptional regulator
MSTETTKASTRERLLETAAVLAYRDGVGVGVETLCKTAGVSKRSMYQLFASKDDLLAASLEDRAEQFNAVIMPPPDSPAGPRGRIMEVFERIEARAPSPDYYGCPYLAVQVELKDAEHPASRVAAQIKQRLLEFFRTEARRGGAADPEFLARQLALLFDGASARAGIGADAMQGGLATRTAGVLLDAAGVRQ